MLIKSVHKAIQILVLFSLSSPLLGITEISRALKLKKPTVQGLVRTLLKEGFLQQDRETRKYRLGLKIYELGIILAGNLEINQKASMPAHELAKKTEQLVHIAIPDQDSCIITLDAYPRSQPFLSRSFGPRSPLYCTALGKAILAFSDQRDIKSYMKGAKLIPYTSNTIVEKNRLLTELEETRRRGYSLNQEEHLLNRAAIGAPIFERGGRLSAAISLVGDPIHIMGEKMDALATEVMTTAMEISRNMGFFLEAPLTEWMNRTRPNLIRNYVAVALNRPAGNTPKTS
jgi:IclR family transcriptional regulator, KDG regulon repressor